jgi:putative membrane protein
MGNRARTFFHEPERQRIEEAIRSVECCTIGEVAVVVTDSSDHYLEAEVLGSVFLSSFASLLLTMSFFHASLWSYIPFSILFFFPFRILLSRVPVLKLSLVGKKRKEAAVRQGALKAFYERGLYRTKQNTGVLFFLSLLEHKVWVLADKGIYDKIDQETLNTFARTVSRGIREGHACDALCQEIRAAGKILATHFPLTPGDINELSNQIITE